MDDLIKRARLGDWLAQKECTKHGILLPCPFCGGKEEVTNLQDYNGNEGWSVSCENCFVEIDGYKTKKEAINAWNCRIEPPSSVD